MASHDFVDALPTASSAGFDPSNRKKLTRRDLARFPSDTLFDKLGRVMCEAECLPRRELFEAWAVARRVRRRLRGGRIIDVACGHGLLAWVMMLLDDTSPRALAVDLRLPPSAARVAAAMAQAWPRLAERVTLEQRALADLTLPADALIVATHACGALTDLVIDKALSVRAPLSVLTCCHDEETCDAGGLRGWLELGDAVDATRAARLRVHGYAVHTQLIPRAITAQNRLLIASPLP